MKKFVIGFVAGATLFGAVGYAATTYLAQPATFKVIVNGEEFQSNPPALVVEGSTYLPLRAMGDALGVPVNWNSELHQAEVGNMAPTASENEYSRNKPAPINTVQTYTYNSEYYTDYSVAVRVVETIRGEEAYAKLKQANLYNEKPDDGYEYVLAKIAISALSVENDEAVNLTPYIDITAFSGNNEELPKKMVVDPEPELAGKIYAGGNAEGWVSFQVRVGDEAPKIAYGLDYNGAGGIWFALQ